MEYAALRKKMVEEQLKPRGITDAKVLAAFGRIERERFVPEGMQGSAYADHPVAIGNGQTISQPYMVALMTQLLGLTGKERVLEIGTGSGYQTAVLAQLADQVYSVERFAEMAKKAQKLLGEMLYANVVIKVGDGSLGWPEQGPFDRIILTAAAPRVPLPLGEQLKEGGKMVLPLGESFSQVLTGVEKKKGNLESLDICGCVFVPLVGKYGLKE
jgi:protein-L-isoaspartate(D-aspartate) O-methyltransferase